MLIQALELTFFLCRKMESATNCEPCQNLGSSVPAEHKCTNCDELYCSSCAKRHKAQKSSASHKLLDLSSNTASFSGQVRVKNVKDNCETSPGKPVAIFKTSNYVTLRWKNTILKQDDFYQVMSMKLPKDRWTECGRTSANMFEIHKLLPDAKYKFRVRVSNDQTGLNGHFSPVSDVIETPESLAETLRKKAKLVDKTDKNIYRLNIKENTKAKNKDLKLKKFTLGKVGTHTKTKTVLLLGASGSGKTTLINAFANYITGVSYEDDFRFTLIDLDHAEEKKVHNQSISQTEWITCYTIYTNKANRVDFNLNLIDTPGFGDTRGIRHDELIIKQITEFFTSKDGAGVSVIDAVCFLLKSPDSRLSVSQAYVFQSVMSLFGKDIKDNICTIITFSDDSKPNVLAALENFKDVEIPYEVYFPFNNSAFDFSKSHTGELSPFYWDMGVKSCKLFFDHIRKLETKSLRLTAEVLRKREIVENTVCTLQIKVAEGLAKINELEQEISVFKNNASEIEANKEYTYPVKITKPTAVDISGKGIFTTHCLTCNFTCHNDCVFANDEDKHKCVAINSLGRCKQCPLACKWDIHKNVPYVMKMVQETVQRNAEEQKKTYENALKTKLTLKQVIEAMMNDVVKIEQNVLMLVDTISNLNNRLQEIALQPNPLEVVRYIEIMILNETQQKENGFMERVEILKNLKHRAEFRDQVTDFKNRKEKVAAVVEAVTESDEGWNFQDIFELFSCGHPYRF